MPDGADVKRLKTRPLPYVLHAVGAQQINGIKNHQRKAYVTKKSLQFQALSAFSTAYPPKPWSILRWGNPRT